MNNNKYKNLFNKINLSDSMVENLKTMPTDSKLPRRSFKFNFATGLAVLIGVFLISNGITYAATGDSLVKKVADGIDKISNHYEADNMEEYKVDEFVDDQGMIHYKYEIDNAEIENVINESALEDENMNFEANYDTGEGVQYIEISNLETESETTTNSDN